jgi:CheY-like chemotaxis protein
MKLNLKSKKILVVEDHAIIREAIKHMLYGLEARNITDTSSGAQAILAMKNRVFDIVICDYHLGVGKNGQQVLEEARHSKLLPAHATFIMVTVEQQQSVVLSALDNKPDEYLTKPFNAQQLLSRLQRCSQRKHYFSSIEQEIQDENIYQAIKLCDEKLELGDKQMRLQLLRIRAELAIETGDLDYAQRTYQQVLKERDLTWARLGLGIIAFKRGHFEQAIGYFQQLLQINPSALDAYDWQAKAHESLQQNQLALETVELAVNLSPQAILRQQKLATLASQAALWEIAQKAYKAAIKLGKNSVHKSSKDFSGLAKIYLKSNATTQAQQLLDELKFQFVNEPDAELQAALLSIDLFKKTGQNTLAQRAYEDALVLSDQFGRLTPKETRLQMVKTCFLNNNFADAENIIDELIKCNIDNNTFLEEIKALCSKFNHDIFPTNVIYNTKQALININNNGVKLFKEGKIKEAISTLENASKIMPDNQTIILNLAKICVHQLKSAKLTKQKLTKAKDYIDKAIQLDIPLDKISHLQAEITKLNHEFISHR